jgi:hypothetical protein
VRVIDALAITIIVVSLLVAGWALATTLRDRPPTVLHLVGLGIVELTLIVQEAVAVQRLVDGARPPQFAVFIGYLVASLVVLPLGGWLAWLEQTRWGSTIITVACLVVPVLVLRLHNLWAGTVG